MIRYFKVKYGFNNLESVSVPEGGELEKVVYAWSEGVPVSVGNKMIQGKHIISIEPDYHRYTGWNPTYEPCTAEDFAQIGRDCPDFVGVLEDHKQKIALLEHKGRTDLIGQNTDIKLLN
jgi:hypothetical protein